MAGHATYPALDGLHIASQSPAIVDGLLRRELGFKGVVMTDSLEAAAVQATGDVEEAAVASAEAGVDVILTTGRGSYIRVYRALLARAKADRAFRAPRARRPPPACSPRNHPWMADTATAFGIGDTVPAFTLTDTEGTAARACPPSRGAARHRADPDVQPLPVRDRVEPAPARGRRGLRARAACASWRSAPTTRRRHPADSPERMAQFVREQDWPIPYAFDESQDVARALGAERTPEVFVLDSEQRLAYRGAPDSDHEDPSQNAAWLRAALDAVLAGREVERAETPAARLLGQMARLTLP